MSKLKWRSEKNIKQNRDLKYYTNFGCWWVSWARGRGAALGCWDLVLAEGSESSLSCSGEHLGQQNLGGSGVPLHPGNLRNKIRSAVVPSKINAIFQANHTLQWGPQKTVLVVQLFYWNSFKLRSTGWQTRGRISYISTRSRIQKYTSRVSLYPIKPCCRKRQQYAAQGFNPNTVYENRKKQVCGFYKGLVWLQE